MKSAIIAAIVAALIGAGASATAASAMLGPPAPVHKRLLCYVGHNGQPSGCVTIVSGGLVAS